ncbi:phBC6A51 family helix-turn-helix protein [Halobacillus ihumii]|uniref:phBC6A51 family helix-turn-helix protein n=1 Tax=Halobacillus ihumii TaxID=2686092 RepID=UPI0013D7ABFE|nr:phBC6A51 family helix-turn-helix protein [Halobacillus ihumii]
MVDMTQFKETQIQAIGYLSMPKKAGMSFDEIAEACGVSVRQLHRWRQKPEFKQAIVEQSLNNVKDEIPDVLSAHKKQAAKGNVKAIELFYKLFGLLVEKQEIEQNVSNKDKDNGDIENELSELRGLIDEAKGD